MCITSEIRRAKSVIKKLALNNLHQAGPSKPIYDDAWKYKNKKNKNPDSFLNFFESASDHVHDIPPAPQTYRSLQSKVPRASSRR